MSEEINRITVDHMSDVLFSPNNEASQNLRMEGFEHFYSTTPSKTKTFPIVISNGDIMLEALSLISPIKQQSDDFSLLTIHRKENISSRKTLLELFKFVSTQDNNFIFPVHPHTSKQINKFHLKIPKNTKAIKALPYSKLIDYASRSQMIFTDSGGLSKEAAWLGKPCIILRQETEHNELIEEHRAVLYTKYKRNQRFKSRAELGSSNVSLEIIKSLDLFKR